jgi:tetratricopeptide (TPR) repeat protein
MTAQGIATYGWWAENVMRHGLKKIDEAISLDKKAFFPRLCRAIYLSYLPEEFMAAIIEFNALLETERDNPSNLYDVYANLIRIYGEHGHYDMVEQVNKELQKSHSHIYKKINYTNTSAKSSGNIMYRSEVIKPPYTITKNTNTEKATSPKDKHLNEHLVILEKSMEKRLGNESFGDFYKRYILLIRQYGETDRAINFFDDLAERYPHSPNVLAASGIITYGFRGQVLLRKALECIEEAIEHDNDNFFSRISHATFIALFPNGFMQSMYELTLLKQTEADFRQKLSLINNRINLICSQHGHDRIPTEYEKPVIKHLIKLDM